MQVPRLRLYADIDLTGSVLSYTGAHKISMPVNGSLTLDASGSACLGGGCVYSWSVTSCFCVNYYPGCSWTPVYHNSTQRTQLCTAGVGAGYDFNLANVGIGLDCTVDLVVRDSAQNYDNTSVVVAVCWGGRGVHTRCKGW